MKLLVVILMVTHTGFQEILSYWSILNQVNLGLQIQTCINLKVPVKSQVTSHLIKNLRISSLNFCLKSQGEAANSWMSWMDQLLTMGNDNFVHKYKVLRNITKLIDIYYDALDAPKQGAKIEIPGNMKAEKYPHYMEKKPSFASESILGIIYDTVEAYQAEDHSNIEIKKLPYFEDEVPEDCLNKWTANYKKYKTDMSTALKNKDREAKNEAAKEVIKDYKKLLYEAEELENSRRKREDLYNEALAIYHVTYDYAKNQSDVKKCGFAWKVAGSALVEYFLMKQPEKSFMCVPSVLREMR